jgi:hypothetical protein
MTDVSRRGFITRGSMSAGLALAGLTMLQRTVNAQSLDGAPSTATTGEAPTTPPVDPVLDLLQAPASFGGPVIIHVRDLAQGDVSVLVGTRELQYRDPALISRLLRGAQLAAEQEA